MSLNLLTKFTEEPQNSAKDLYLELYDANTNNKTVPQVTLYITISQNNKTLMQDLFHSGSGEITLEIIQTNFPYNKTVNAEHEPFLNAWINNTGGTIPLQAPVGQSGLYHIHVEAVALCEQKDIQTPDQTPKFDSWWFIDSIGNISNTTPQINPPIVPKSPVLTDSKTQTIINAALSVPGLKAWSNQWQYGWMDFSGTISTGWQYAIVHLRLPLNASAPLSCVDQATGASIKVDISTNQVVEADYPTLQNFNCNVNLCTPPIGHSGGCPTNSTIIKNTVAYNAYLANYTNAQSEIPPPLFGIKINKHRFLNTEKPIIEITGEPSSIQNLEIIRNSTNQTVSTNSVSTYTDGLATLILDIRSYHPDFYYVLLTHGLYEKTRTGFIVQLQSPIKQFKSGINWRDIKCASNLELIIKIEDNSPACVSSQTSEKLMERNVACVALHPLGIVPQMNSTNVPYAQLLCMGKNKPSIISNLSEGVVPN